MHFNYFNNIINSMKNTMIEQFDLFVKALKGYMILIILFKIIYFHKWID